MKKLIIECQTDEQADLIFGAFTHKIDIYNDESDMDNTIDSLMGHANVDCVCTKQEDSHYSIILS